ncbi:MAG: hypothetical protein HY918_01820 [Candidatus Doudnabacteria bacterium]|nr:hypothetical protein [Candidatus Doudnabacteria bacterium]
MLKWGLPYGVSTLAAFAAAGAERYWQISEILMVALCWAFENGGYYATAKFCDRYLPANDKIFKESRETLKQLVIVEGLDSAIRLFLIWLLPRLLGDRGQGAALGSVLADITFAFSLNYSHRLVAICEILSERLTSPYGLVVARCNYFAKLIACAMNSTFGPANPGAAFLI